MKNRPKKWVDRMTIGTKLFSQLYFVRILYGFYRRYFLICCSFDTFKDKEQPIKNEYSRDR